MVHEGDEPGPKASAKTLKSASSENILVNVTHCYRIIQFAIVFNAISDRMVCRNFKKTVTSVDSARRGFGFKIVLRCQCGIEVIPSCSFIQNAYEINRRIVFVMKLLGVVSEGLNMGEGLGNSAYTNILQHIYESAKFTLTWQKLENVLQNFTLDTISNTSTKTQNLPYIPKLECEWKFNTGKVLQL